MEPVSVTPSPSFDTTPVAPPATTDLASHFDTGSSGSSSSGLSKDQFESLSQVKRRKFFWKSFMESMKSIRAKKSGFSAMVAQELEQNGFILAGFDNAQRKSATKMLSSVSNTVY